MTITTLLTASLLNLRTAKASSNVHDNSNSVNRSCIKAMNLMDGLLGLYVMPKKPQ